MSNTIFTGVGTALITPMNKDFSINYSKLAELIDYQVNHNADALVVAGTTGEGSTLNTEEYKSILQFAVKEANHKVPIIAGAGSNNTSHAVELTKIAQDAGVDGLLHVTPYYNKTSQKGLVLHFTECAKATDLPIILYNIPSRTGVNIEPETYLKLCDVDNIVGVKEAIGNFSQIIKIEALCGDRLDIYSGNDDQITSALSIGAKGVISVLANILPNAVHDLCKSFLDGNPHQSEHLQIEYLKLINMLFCDVNPIPIKQAMNYMGIDVGPCRLPLCEMEDDKKQQLKAVLKEYNLVK